VEARVPQGSGAAQGSKTHLVLIPSYNPGPKVIAAVRDALDQWAPVWVVVDGSTDESLP
jgi:glycosyltransferase involved in cell wall biosynthesis